jgi:uncharacterized protein (DUF427 family)
MGQLRNLAHRIETRQIDGRVRVEVDGVVLADSTDVLALSEGKLPTRYYFPADDVRSELLKPSDTHTRCPFKGTASYYAFGEQADFAWYYPDPIEDVEAIRGRLAFYNDRVKLFVDDEPAG